MTSLRTLRKRLSGIEQIIELAPEEIESTEPTYDVEEIMFEDIDIHAMTKQQLDEYAEQEYEIHLDRRQSKENMIKEFLSKIEERE